MSNLHIIPGAIIEEGAAAGEPLYRHLRMDAALPEQGGVGKIPLPIRHQGSLPICTGVAAANCRMIQEYLLTGQMVNLSALFIYQMNRLFDGLGWHARGSTLHASMQTLQQKGACLERLYPTTAENCYQKFPGKYKPADRILRNAKQYRISRYARCETLEDILQALADQRPVVFSMIIYTDFYGAYKGWVSPEIRGQRIGGHSMVAVNYDLNQEYIEVVQSWGREIGGPTDNGYMYIPFSWFTAETEDGVPLMFEAFVVL